jgi:hypothetical protein
MQPRFRPDLSGDIWIADISEGAGAKQRLTFEGGYRWPVFSTDDQSIIDGVRQFD